MNGNDDTDDWMNRIKEFVDATIGDTKEGGGDKRNNDVMPAPDRANATHMQLNMRVFLAVTFCQVGKQ